MIQIDRYHRISNEALSIPFFDDNTDFLISKNIFPICDPPPPQIQNLEV